MQKEDIHREFPQICELGVKVVSYDGADCVVDAGLPFMLKVPRNEAAGRRVGSYAGYGSQRTVARTRLERIIEQTTRVNSHISSGGTFEVTGISEHKSKTGMRYFKLTVPEWPRMSFTGSEKQVSKADYYTLASGGSVRMAAVGPVDPSRVTRSYLVPLKSGDCAAPELHKIYDGVVTGYHDDGLLVEVNRRTGSVERDMLPHDKRDSLRRHFPLGSRFRLRCIDVRRIKQDYSEYSYGIYYDDEPIEPGTVILGKINNFEGGMLTVDFGPCINHPAYAPKYFNIYSYVESGIYREGTEVLLKVIDVPRDDGGRYMVELVPDTEKDVFGLEPGDTFVATARSDDRFLRFEHNGRRYGIYAVDDNRQWLNEWLSRAFPHQDVRLRGVVIGKNNLSGPRIAVNTVSDIYDNCGSDRIIGAVLRHFGSDGYIFSYDGYWIRLSEHVFDNIYPTGYRPSPGDTVRMRVEKGAGDNVELHPLYDREEVEYRLPQGVYRGEIEDYYLNDRYVVRTLSGARVTARKDSDCPDYISDYFIEQHPGEVTVTVDADGGAVLTLPGIKYDCPYKGGQVLVHVEDVMPFGLLVRYGEYYGYIPGTALEWRHKYAVDLEAYRGRDLAVRMASRTGREAGLWFDMRNYRANPYMSCGLKPGDECDVTVIGHISRNGLEVSTPSGLRGIVTCYDSGWFMTASSRPARYIGETFRAIVSAIDPYKGELEFKAKSLSGPSPWKNIIKRHETVPAAVVGHVGDEVLARCGDTIGTLINDNNMLQRLSVNPQQYPVGHRFDAEVLCVRSAKRQIMLTSTRRMEMRIKHRELRFHTVYRVTVRAIVSDGVVVDVDGITALVTRRAAVEAFENAADDFVLDSAYRAGDSLEVYVAYIDERDKGVYVVPCGSRLYNMHMQNKVERLKVEGTVAEFSPETGYVVSLDNGMTAVMSREAATWNHWKTGILPCGERYEFAFVKGDFKRHCPIVSRRGVLPNPWLSMSFDKGDAVRATVEGVIAGSIVISYGEVRQILHEKTAADLAGRPWDEGYVPLTRDFPIGMQLDLLVDFMDVAKCYVEFYPDRRRVISRLAGRTVTAVVRHVDDAAGLWVEIKDAGGLVGLVPPDRLSHAADRVPADLFSPGEELSLRCIGTDERGCRPILSRKDLLMRRPENVRIQESPAPLVLSRVSDEFVLAEYGGHEVLIPRDELGPNKDFVPGQRVRVAYGQLKKWYKGTKDE